MSTQKSSKAKAKTKSSQAAPAKKKVSNWGGKRAGSGGVVKRTVAEKLLLGLRVRPVDFEREGLPIPKSRNEVRALKQAAERAKAGIMPAPAGKELRCHRHNVMPRCGSCYLCLDGGPEYWASEEEQMEYLFGGDGYLGWPNGDKLIIETGEFIKA